MKITKVQCAKFFAGIVAITSFLIVDYLRHDCIAVIFGPQDAICGAEARRTLIAVTLVAYFAALIVWIYYRRGLVRKVSN